MLLQAQSFPVTLTNHMVRRGTDTPEDFAPTLNLGTDFMLHEGDFSCQDEADLPEHKIQPIDSKLVLSSPPSGHDLPVNGKPYVSIKGGAPASSLSDTATQEHIPMAHDYASTTDCILQNLTMTIGNPSAHCFANAPWRAFTWTCALLQETSAQPWGTLQEAVQESLDTAEHVDLQQLPVLHALWKQHDHNIQGDASHFVNSLWLHSQTRAFHYRFAEIKENGYLVDHVQMPILVPYPDDWPDDVKFQDLINNWANQGMGQYLMDDKRVLICHVTRNTCVDGIATKHNKPFNPYGNFTVPRSLDGFARTSAEFVPAVLICHRGKTHTTGHYFAILIYRDLTWLADDGKVPTYLPFLTPKLASQITQVWAVSVWTLSEHLNKYGRASHDLRTPTLADRSLIGTEPVHIFAETHLDPQRHCEICQYFTIRRRTAFGTPAHGGLLVLADPSSCLTDLEAYTIQQCGYHAFLWQASWYPRTNETLHKCSHHREAAGPA